MLSSRIGGRRRGRAVCAGGAAAVFIAVLPVSPAQAIGTDTRTAPFDAAVAESGTLGGGEVPICSSDVSGAVSAEVVAPPKPMSQSEFPQGGCITGVSVTKVRSNGQERITAVGTFRIDSASVEVPPGSEGSGEVIPCVSIVPAGGGYRETNCNYHFDDTNGLYTPMFGPFLPTGASAQATDETWTWDVTIEPPCCVAAGMYEVTAYLMAGAHNNGDAATGPVKTRVSGAVSTISVKYSG